MQHILPATLLLGLAAALAGCGNKEPTPAPATGSPAAPAATPEFKMPTEPNNIVNIAGGSKDHTTLVKALKAADYLDSVATPGPITVFAPTDAAFAKLPKADLDELMKPEKVSELKELLKHHVVPSTYEVKDLKDGMTLGMLTGKITIKAKDGKLSVDGANVIASIKASNGIVHVLDAVLVPPK